MNSSPEYTEFVNRVEASAARDGMQVVSSDLCGTPTLIANTSKFRWRWAATRLHVFLFVAHFNETQASAQAADAWLAGAASYALANKAGLPRGVGSAVAVVAVIASNDATDELKRWAASPHGGRAALFTYPVVVETGRRSVAFGRRRIIGIAYNRYVQDLVHRHIEASLST